MSVKFTGVVLVLDRPTHNGRVYPRSEIEAAVKRAQTVISRGNLVGEADPDYDYDGDLESIAINSPRVTHVVDRLWVEQTPEGPVLMGEIHTLDPITHEAFPLTPFAELGLSKGDLVMRPRGTGMIDDEGIVSEYRLLAIDLLPKESAA